MTLRDWLWDNFGWDIYEWKKQQRWGRTRTGEKGRMAKRQCPACEGTGKAKTTKEREI